MNGLIILIAGITMFYVGTDRRGQMSGFEFAVSFLGACLFLGALIGALFGVWA